MLDLGLVIAIGALLLASVNTYVQYRMWAADRPHLRIQLLAVRNAPWVAEGTGEQGQDPTWHAVIEVRNNGKRPAKIIKVGFDNARGSCDAPQTAGSEFLPASLWPGQEFVFYLFEGLRGLAQVSCGATGPVTRVWADDADGHRRSANVDHRRLAMWADPAFDGGFTLPYEDPALPQPRVVLGDSR